MTHPLLWQRLAIAASVLFALFVVILAGLALPSRSHASPPNEIDLFDPRVSHGVSFSCPPEGEIPSYVHEKSFRIGGEERQSLFMHPPAAATHLLQIPRDATLQFSVAIEPEAWEKPGDGVDFVVRIKYWDSLTSSNKEQTIFSQYLNPKADPSVRRWVDASVDLRPFQEMPAEVIFQTLPRESADFDWAGWSRLRIVRR